MVGVGTRHSAGRRVKQRSLRVPAADYRHMALAPSALLTAASAIALMMLAAHVFCVSSDDLVGFWSTDAGKLVAVRKDGNALQVWSSGPRARVRQLWCRLFVSEPSAGQPGEPTDYGRLTLNGRRVVWRHGPTWYRQGVN